MPRSLRHLRGHDYPFLIRRWRRIAAQTGLVLKKYGEAGGYDLFYLRTRRIRPNVPAVYFSAGIHGDEVGATEGLITWAEAHPAALRELNVLIFPCLNPWGLVNNARRDDEGRDLNRSFHDSAVPQIVEQMKIFAGQEFDLTLMLHEDYDALGVYIYEVRRIRPYWAEALLRAAAKKIAPDPRGKIEGRSAKGGVVRRSINPAIMPDWPEAFVLYFQGARRVFTIETPSEFHLDDRVAAHAAIISQAVALCRKEFSFPTPP